MERGDIVSKDFVLDCQLLFVLGRPSTPQEKATEVFHLLRNPVYRYLFRALKDQQEAEDLTQEVFLRFYTCLSQGYEVRSPRAWAFRVARNLALDRRKRKQPVGPLDPMAWERAEDPSAGAEQMLLDEDKHQRLRRAVAQLSSHEKECLELRAEGLSYQEIADALKMRLPTLVKFLGRIIKKLAREVRHD